MDLNELNEIAEKESAKRKKVQVRCCMSAGCMSTDAKGVKASLEAAAAKTDDVEVVRVGCMGLCSLGPLVKVDPEGKLYEYVTPADAPSIIDAVHGGECTAKQIDTEQPFFTEQVTVVREHSGMIDPERIEDYIAT